MPAADNAHPLDVDLVAMAEHLRKCQVCRRGFARVLYEVDEDDEYTVQGAADWLVR